MVKWIDLPPVWLFCALAAAWATRQAVPTPGLLGAWTGWAGNTLIVLGLVLMLAAVVGMAAARTTVIPHKSPSALVTGGVFRLSRNPIYLGDALLLTGVILRWDAVPALPLVAVFVWIIQRRFVLPEEARLRALFGPAFDDWARRTRRWI